MYWLIFHIFRSPLGARYWKPWRRAVPWWLTAGALCLNWSSTKSRVVWYLLGMWKRLLRMCASWSGTRRGEILSDERRKAERVSAIAERRCRRGCEKLCEISDVAAWSTTQRAVVR